MRTPKFIPQISKLLICTVITIEGRDRNKAGFSLRLINHYNLKS